LTRGRAYHKGENAHIAQEDRIHVRRLFGNQRLDTPKVVSLMNNHHREARRLYHNVFSPCVNLIEKERVGSKTIDRHDDPKTPHQRIMDFDPIPQTTKNALVKRLYEKR